LSIVPNEYPSSLSLSLSPLQVYSTGYTNSMLSARSIGLWIWNAVLFAIIFCVLFFNVMGRTFEDFGLYEMGTTIFTGLILGLQCKVAFLHHMWTRVHIISMIVSVIGLFFTLFVLNAAQTPDNYGLYYVVNFLYQQPVYWFFGAFSIPIMVYLIDFVGSSVYVFFLPTPEMIMRENERGMGPKGLLVDKDAEEEA
jgi:hypothetical protein